MSSDRPLLRLLASVALACSVLLMSAQPHAQYPLYPRLHLPVPAAQRAPADRAAAFAKGLPTPRNVSAAPQALLAFNPPGTVSVVNGVFALNGQKKFLLFISYFGGLRDAVLHPDWLIGNLDAAKQLGFDGIRVFPNWWWNLDGTCNPVDVYPLVKGDGSFNFDPLAGVPPIPASWTYQPPGGYLNSVAGRFQFLLDVAWEKGLVVELALAGETSATAGQRLWDGNNLGPSTQKYRNALKNLAAGLSTLQFFGDSSVSPPSPAQIGYRHVIFDVWNEANIGFSGYPWCKPVLPGRTPSNASLPLDTNQPSIANFASAVKEGDPLRLVTASLAGEILSPNAAAHWANSNISYAGHHDPRIVLGGFQWWQATPLHIIGYAPAGYLGWRQLPITGVGGIDTFPVSFSEPERHRFVPESSCSQNAYFPTQQCQDNYPVSSFIYAATQAKANGLASWTWHTEKLFRLGSNYSPGLSQVEDLFLQQIGPAMLNTAWPR